MRTPSPAVSPLWCLLLPALSGGCRCRSETVPPPPPAHSVTDASTAPRAVSTDASPAPSPVDATAATAVAGPSCELVGAAAEVGTQAEVASISLFASHGTSPRYFAAWVVAPRFPNGGDDVALAELSPEGSLRTMLDPEEPSTARGLARSPVVMFRAYAHPVGSGYAGDSDRLSRDDDGNDIVECGDLTEQIATIDATAADGVAHNPRPGAMFYCRTAFNTPRPFILGMRGVPGSEPVPDNVNFFATRETAVPPQAPGFWPLAYPAAALRRARNPATAMRDVVPDGMEIIALPGVGYALTFRFQHHIHLGYLNESLQPVGALAQLGSLGGEPGRPRIATDGARVLVVFADRAASDAAPPRYALHATVATFGNAPPRPTRLATDLPASIAAADEFAPSTVAQPDGSWTVAFSYGALELRADADTQAVYVRNYATDLRPRGAAVLASGSNNASDPRLVVVGDHLLLAMASGRRSNRTVSVQQVRCVPPARP